MSDFFPPRPAAKKDLETGTTFTPTFDANGLIPCVTTDAETGEVLMVAFMNDLALSETVKTGEVHYWSRSRGKLWKKGESSGMTQKVRQMLTDCDQDCIVLKVEVGAAHADGTQASCHVGFRNCFYRAIEIGNDPAAGPVALKRVQKPVFDPETVYGK